MEKYVEIATSVASIIITATTVIVAICQQGKKEKKQQVLQKVIECAKIVEQIPNFVKEAEQIFEGNKKGSLKMNYVLKEIRNECILKNIEFEENEQEFKRKVEEVLETPQKKELM